MILKRLLPLFLLLTSFTAKAQFSGNALDFDGTNDMVVVSSVPALFSNPASNDFTIEAWVNPRGSVFARIFFAQPGTTNFVSLGTGAGNVIYFYVIVNSTTYSVATSAAIPQNQWTHVAARWTAATNSPEVFFNGVLQAAAAGGTSSTGTSGLMVLGSRPGGFQYFNGALDEVRVWSEARTLCEIQGNMNNSITGITTNLVVNYNFNQGVAAGNNTGTTTLPDISGNAYDGTLTNFGLTAGTSNWIASAATVTASGPELGGVSTSESALVCPGSSYTFPDGSTTTNITSQVSHVSTLTTTGGCDSLVTTTVDVYAAYSLSESATVCSGSSYTFPDASTTTNITAQVVHTSNLQTIAGCDSTITTTVDVNPVYTLSESAAICSGDSFTFPDGSTQTNITSQVIYTSNLQTIAGCDSTITTTVDVNPVYTLTESAAVCTGDSFTFPDGSTQTNITSQVVYTSNLQTVAGCDSTITTTVDVNPVYVQNETAGICTGGSYTFPDGSTQSNITSQVVYTSNLQTVAGCDSTITTTVDVYPIYALSESDSICSGGSYTFPDGSTQTNITSQVIYTSNLLSVAGCDSIITTTVDVIQVNTTVTQSGLTLTAGAASATYQWLDCGNGYAPVAGATGQTFSPTVSGNYAAAITQNGCTDTSACFLVPVGVNEASGAHYNVSVYPNPAQDVVFVEFENGAVSTIELIELSGAVVRTMQFNGTRCTIDMTGLASGCYWISIVTPEGRVVKPVVKE